MASKIPQLKTSIIENILGLQSFCIYGHGTTGKSVISYFNRKGFKNYCVYDDNKNLKFNNFLNKNKKKISSKFLDTADFIVMSPGISLKKAKLKKKLLKNKDKIEIVHFIGGG